MKVCTSHHLSFKGGLVHSAGVLGAPLIRSRGGSSREDRRSARSLRGRTLEHWQAEAMERKTLASAHKSVLWNKLFHVIGAISLAILYNKVHMWKSLLPAVSWWAKPLPWSFSVLTEMSVRSITWLQRRLSWGPLWSYWHLPSRSSASAFYALSLLCVGVHLLTLIHSFKKCLLSF